MLLISNILYKKRLWRFFKMIVVLYSMVQNNYCFVMMWGWLNNRIAIFSGAGMQQSFEVPKCHCQSHGDGRCLEVQLGKTGWHRCLMLQWQTSALSPHSQRANEWNVSPVCLRGASLALAPSFIGSKNTKLSFKIEQTSEQRLAIACLGDRRTLRPPSPPSQQYLYTVCVCKD